FETLKGYPSHVDAASASTMREAMAQMAELQGQVRAVRAQPSAQRMAAARKFAAENREPPTAALAAVRLVKDSAETLEDWTWLAKFIDQLPAEAADLEGVRETYAFALANMGKPMDAIAKIEALIARSGPTPERLGLLGGR